MDRIKPPLPPKVWAAAGVAAQALILAQRERIRGEARRGRPGVGRFAIRCRIPRPRAWAVALEGKDTDPLPHQSTAAARAVCQAPASETGGYH